MSDPTTQQHSHAQPGKHVTFNGRAVEGEEEPLLEGRLVVAPDGALHPGALLCHANPAAGGDMDMEIVGAIEEALAEVGVATLRYNSRGVGNSTGAVSKPLDRKLVVPEGNPEREDVGAACDFLAMQEGVDEHRLALVGHSFGARIALSYLAAHPEETRIAGVVCIGLPVGWRDLSYLGQWPHPKLFITGERDDFCPPEELAEFVAKLPEPSNIVTLKSTGHFFEGREHDLAAVVAEFVRRVLTRNS